MKIRDPYVQKIFDSTIANSNKVKNLKEEFDNKLFRLEEKLTTLEEKVMIVEKKTNYMFNQFDSLREGALDSVTEIVKLKKRDNNMNLKTI